MRFLFIILFSVSLGFSADSPYVVILGIAQDGGSPQSGCEKLCCKDLWENGEKEKVSCIGIVDPRSGKSWLIDATLDFPEQYRIITKEHHTKLAGIFLTHAHMGHYTGLLHLGHEVMGAKDVPVFAMPRMKEFLETNGPWDQLVSMNNIKIQPMKNDKEIRLADGLFIEPFLVPHRDEYSETVGYKIMGTKRSVLFIPDIDKWAKWDQEIFEVVQHIDIALLDGTFYSQGELPNRDMSEIPHPFIVESMDKLYNLNSPNRNKVHFIHFNHSNPAIRAGAAANQIRSNRFNVAQEGMIFPL